MIELFLSSIAILSSITLLFYYFFFFIKIVNRKRSTIDYEPAISVIICAKNEESNLRLYLEKILTQEYSKFEVILVNDQSIDNTKYLLEELQKSYKNLIVSNIADHINSTPGKKFALSIGIKTANYKNILLTDADCKPVSKYWIKEMANNFKENDIVLGYGSYEKKNTLLNKFIRFDTFNVAQQYISYSIAGYTYMGVGRNLGYTKDVFFKNKGFANHIQLPSGDDDLFVQEVASKHNVTVVFSKHSHTISEAHNNWQDWMYQKRRHLTTAKYYKKRFKILLSLYPYAQLLFWISILILYLYNPIISFLLLLIKLMSTYIINYKTMRKLEVFDLYWLHPLYEIMLILIQGFFVLLNLFIQPKKWSR